MLRKNVVVNSVVPRVPIDINEKKTVLNSKELKYVIFYYFCFIFLLCLSSPLYTSQESWHIKFVSYTIQPNKPLECIMLVSENKNLLDHFEGSRDSNGINSSSYFAFFICLKIAIHTMPTLTEMK